MLKPNTDRVIGTIVLGVFIAICVAVVMYFGSLIGPRLRTVADRTENTLADVTYAEPGGFGMVIKYTFVYQHRTYNGEANCERCGAQYTQAKNTGKVDVWFNPNDPTNSYVEKPRMGMYYFLFLLYWGTLALLVGTYGTYLYKTWKKPKQPTPEEMGLDSEALGLGGTLPGGRHGYGCQCWSCLSQLDDR